MSLLKTLKRFDNIDEYVKGRQDNSFDTDQRDIGRYIRFIADVFDKYTELTIKFAFALKYHKDFAIWKENRKDINSRIAKYLKSDDAKLTDKAKEIEDIILAIVNHISVDDKRLFSQDDKLELLRKGTSKGDKYECATCGRWFTEDELTVDHIEPWSKGGRTVLSNAQRLCRPCNSKKGNR